MKEERKNYNKSSSTKIKLTSCNKKSSSSSGSPETTFFILKQNKDLITICQTIVPPVSDVMANLVNFYSHFSCLLDFGWDLGCDEHIVYFVVGMVELNRFLSFLVLVFLSSSLSLSFCVVFFRLCLLDGVDWATRLIYGVRVCECECITCCILAVLDVAEYR